MCVACFCQFEKVLLPEYFKESENLYHGGLKGQYSFKANTRFLLDDLGLLFVAAAQVKALVLSTYGKVKTLYLRIVRLRNSLFLLFIFFIRKQYYGLRFVCATNASVYFSRFSSSRDQYYQSKAESTPCLHAWEAVPLSLQAITLHITP